MFKVSNKSKSHLKFVAKILLAFSVTIPVLGKAQNGRRIPLSVDGGDPALGSLLENLQNNESDYKRTVPNLFCNEVVTSEVASPYPRRTKSESTFRLRRVTTQDGAEELQESHLLKSRDGKPITGDGVRGPAVLEGVFSRGLEPLRTVDRACYRYKLHPVQKGRESKQIVVDFALLPSNDRAEECPEYEEASGQAWIDLKRTHVVRLDMRIPHHFFPGGIRANWDWSAVYKPVLLNGNVIWLPLSIESRAKSEYQNTNWKFKAQYSDYHLLHVESRIVPLGK